MNDPEPTQANNLEQYNNSEEEQLLTYNISQLSEADLINYNHIFKDTSDEYIFELRKMQRNGFQTEGNINTYFEYIVANSNIRKNAYNKFMEKKKNSNLLWNSYLQELSSQCWMPYLTAPDIQNNIYVSQETCKKYEDESLHLHTNILEKPDMNYNNLYLLQQQIQLCESKNKPKIQAPKKHPTSKEALAKACEKSGKKKQEFGSFNQTLKNPIHLKVRLYPNKETTKKFNWILGCCRVTRNNALYLIKNLINYEKKRIKRGQKIFIFKRIQKMIYMTYSEGIWVKKLLFHNLVNRTDDERKQIYDFITSKVVKFAKQQWLHECHNWICHNCIRHDAVVQLSRDVVATVRRRENETNPKPFQMHYKKKDKTRTETFYVEAPYVNFQPKPKDLLGIYDEALGQTEVFTEVLDQTYQSDDEDSDQVLDQVPVVNPPTFINTIINNPKKGFVKIYGNIVEYRDSPEATAFLKRLVCKPFRPNNNIYKGKRFCKDCIIQYERATKRYYILVPYEKGEFELPSEKRRRLKRENIPSAEILKSIGAMDPGVRKPIVIYDVNGRVLEVDTSFYKCVDKYNAKIIKKAKQTTTKKTHSYFRQLEKTQTIDENGVTRTVIKGQIKKMSGEQWNNNKRNEICREFSRIRRVRHHHHYTAANYLLDNFEKIIVPKFETSSMIKRSTRVLRKKSVKDLLNFSHSNFRERLVHKGGDRVLEETEYHTTVTCGICGSYNYVGASKVYECHTCKFRGERDPHSARTIFIKKLKKLV